MDIILEIAEYTIKILGATTLVLLTLLLIGAIIILIKIYGIVQIVKHKTDRTVHIIDMVGTLLASPFVKLISKNRKKENKKN